MSTNSEEKTTFKVKESQNRTKMGAGDLRKVHAGVLEAWCEMRWLYRRWLCI